MSGQHYRVLLIGNYRLDRQMSMLRYYDMLLHSLRHRGIEVSGIEPTACIGQFSCGPLTKWLRYVDKYILFPFALRKHFAILEAEARHVGQKLIIHITDHSNALYQAYAGANIIMATCHDLLAVRGAFGEDTDCPASRFGKFLQSCILANLRKVRMVICVSSATQGDLRRLAPETASVVIHLPLNQPYAVLIEEETKLRLSTNMELLKRDYILHVGSSLKRKNREGILRIFARIADRFSGILVFAGENLTAEQRNVAQQLKISHRVVEISKPSSQLIEALYTGAYAFIFPSKTEGFGWPVIEAQACGCPVLAARTTSLPEVLGRGGLLRDLADEEGFANDLLDLQDNQMRCELNQKGFANLNRFSADKISDQYIATYQSLAG